MIIVSAVSGEFYTIVTKYGILANKLRSGDLELYNGHIDFDYKLITKTVSLTTACKESAERQIDLKLLELKCACKSACSDLRYKCTIKKSDSESVLIADRF
jgi:hypothetical protein